MSESDAQRRGTEREFSLWWAVAISILLHVVLALMSGWLPVISSAPIAEPPEDSVLQFTFNQPAEDAAEQDSPPRGDVPFETPEPQPQPSVEPTPPPTDPGFEAQVPVPPTEQTPGRRPGPVESSTRSHPKRSPAFPRAPDRQSCETCWFLGR